MMTTNRRKFIGMTAGAVAMVGVGGYLITDKQDYIRNESVKMNEEDQTLSPDEKQILFFASLAPSGHNTQPWFVKYIQPFHWIIGNDKRRWLPAVDPAQRETILSIGTFIQNIDDAAGAFGYVCDWTLLARSNQDENILEVKLVKKEHQADIILEKIKSRRTIRSGYLGDPLKKEDVEYLIGSGKEPIYYLPCNEKASRYLNEQTIEANRIQVYRDPAQSELADWVRFSKQQAQLHRDGLSTASMEISGIAGWVVRNFYDKNNVMQADFRKQSLEKVIEQVSRSAGWILITSKDDSVSALLEAGRRMQKIFLKVKERNIAIHPMTQILEESSTRNQLNTSIGISENIQFILRTGYVKTYPQPVSLRRPVEWFLRK